MWARPLICAPRCPGPSRARSWSGSARGRELQGHLHAGGDRSRARLRGHRRGRQHLPGLVGRHRLPQRRPHQRRGVGGPARADRPFLHTDFTIVPYEAYVELAERLLARTPITGPKKAAFFNSGAEAVENAVKVAKLATGRQAVIAFEGAFHGRTLMAMSLTSKPHPYKAGHGAVRARGLPRAVPLPVPLAGRRSAGEALAALRADVHHARRRPRTWPRSSSSRCRARADSWFRRPSSCAGLREIADEHGIVLIADEVQSGFGRTGKLFAIEHFGVEPDLISVAKSIAAGVPDLGRAGPGRADGRAARQRHRRHLRRLAAGLRRRDGGAGRDRAARPAGSRPGDRRAHPRSVSSSWPSGMPQIGDVRGLGPMLAIEFVRDPVTKQPAPEIATAVVRAAPPSTG